MAISSFPDPNEADENGFLAIGGDLEPESILLAYSKGIFPWPHQGHLCWFCPEKRAVVFTAEYKVSKSLQKLQKKNIYSFKHNYNFPAVVKACATNRKEGTWITDEMQKAYVDLFSLGFCYSYEVYRENNLVGGLYGVRLKHFFAGESMYHTEDNTSKLAFSYMVEHLKTEGVEWIDCQMMTPHLKSLGAREIPRKEFLAMVGG